MHEALVSALKNLKKNLKTFYKLFQTSSRSGKLLGKCQDFQEFKTLYTNLTDNIESTIHLQQCAYSRARKAVDLAPWISFLFASTCTVPSCRLRQVVAESRE